MKYFSDRFQKVYFTPKNVSINESFLLFRGLSFHQYTGTQLKPDYRFLCQDSFVQTWHFSPGMNTEIVNLPNYQNFCRNLPWDMQPDITNLKWVSYFNRKIVSGSILTQYDVNTGEPIFYEVESLFLEKIYGCLCSVTIITDSIFNYHYQSFEMCVPKIIRQWSLLNQNTIEELVICNRYNVDGQEYVV